LLGFGLLALIPIPPLDGFGIMWNAVRRPGNGLQWMRLWFDHKNIGVVILVVLAFFPLGNSFLLVPLDLIGTLFMLPWG
jgi:Zn-dependent protease